MQGEFSQWRWVLSGVSQGSVLGPVLFLIFNDDLEDGIQNMFYKAADDIKVLGQVHSDAEQKSYRMTLINLLSGQISGKCPSIQINVKLYM